MRKLQLLREPFEVRPTLKHSIDIRLSPEFDRNCCKVSVGDGNTYTLCGNHGSFGVDDHIAVNMSPYLERLSFALFLFAADIRNDVVDDFGKIGKRFAGARNCLEGCDEDLFGFKIEKRCEGGNIALYRAVGLHGDKTFFCAETLALCRDNFRMVAVDFGNHHRHVECMAVCGVV